MKNLLIQTVLAASDNDGDSGIWIKMLVLVLLAAAAGIYSLVKTKAKKTNEIEQDYAKDIGIPQSWRVRQIERFKEQGSEILASIKEPALGLKAAAAGRNNSKYVTARDRSHDLHSGMELLELELLLDIVENTEELDKNNTVMRKLNFNELVRRKKLNVVDSNVLKAYALNKDKLFSKDIQCEAIKELARRTVYKKSNIPIQSIKRPTAGRAKTPVASSLFE